MHSDRFLFNRVLFELGYTAIDVLHDMPRPRGTGEKKIFVPFANLLLALCHIRFSSSCLTLAQEVGKSEKLVERYEEHAAKMLQIAARAFCTRRRMDVMGRRAPLGKVWSAYNHFGGEPTLEEYAKTDATRCRKCTLPTLHPMWCRCSRFKEAKAQAVLEKKIDLQLLTPAERLKLLKTEAKAAAEKKLEEQQESISQEHDLLKHVDEIKCQQNAGSEDAHEIFGLDKAADKIRWDAAVDAARLLCLSSFISTDRLVPEHVVANAFNQLQEVANKHTSTNCFGVGKKHDVQDADLSDDQYNDNPDCQAIDTAVEATELKLDPQDVIAELTSIFELTDQALASGFSLFDSNRNGIITELEFKRGLRHLHKSLVVTGELNDEHLDAYEYDEEGESEVDDVQNHVAKLSSLMIDAICQSVAADQNRPGGVIHYGDFIAFLRNRSVREGQSTAIRQFSDRVAEHGRPSHDHGYGDAGDLGDSQSTTNLDRASAMHNTGTLEGDSGRTTFNNPLSEQTSDTHGKSVVSRRSGSEEETDTAAEMEVETVMSNGSSKRNKKKQKKKKDLKREKKKANKSGQAKTDREGAVLFENPLDGTSVTDTAFEAGDSDVQRVGNAFSFELESQNQKNRGRAAGSNEESGRTGMFSRTADKLLGVTKLKGIATKPASFFYRVIAEEVNISETVELESPKIGVLMQGLEFSTTRRQVEDGCVRVKCDSGWVTVMVPGSTDTGGVLQLQEILRDAKYVYHAATTGFFTEGVDETSAKCGVFVKGHAIAATEQVWEPHIRDTIRVKAEQGWASVTTKDDNVIVPVLALEDPWDYLRWFLRNLTADKLHRQATLIECDAGMLEEYHPQVCPNATSELVELIVNRYYTAEHALQLIELPAGWSGEEDGSLEPGARVEVQNEGLPTGAGLTSKWQRHEDTQTRRALNGRRGYVVRGVSASEYEVQIDGSLQTYVLSRGKLKHMRFDETKPRSLFDTVATDDTKHFRWLLNEPTSSQYCPPEAIATKDGVKLESPEDRIQKCRNTSEETLYQAAMNQGAVRVASMLRHHLMFRAVELDNLDDETKGTPLFKLLNEGERAHRLDDGEQGEPHGTVFDAHHVRYSCPSCNFFGRARACCNSCRIGRDSLLGRRQDTTTTDSACSRAVGQGWKSTDTLYCTFNGRPMLARNF